MAGAGCAAADLNADKRVGHRVHRHRDGEPEVVRKRREEIGRLEGSALVSADAHGTGGRT